MNINALFDKARQGDEIAEKKLFEALSVRFRTIVHHRIWNKNDLEDVVQEALMTIFGEYKGVDIQTSFSAWTVKVLDNRILAYIKRKQTSQSRLTETPPEECSITQPVQSSGLRTKLLRCLKELFSIHPRYARVLNLHYQGFTNDEVCQRLNIKAGYSYVILSRARQLLAVCLDKQNEAGR